MATITDVLETRYFVQDSNATHPWAVRCMLVLDSDGELHIDGLFMHDSIRRTPLSIAYTDPINTARKFVRILKMRIDYEAAMHPDRYRPLWCNDHDVRILRADMREWLEEIAPCLMEEDSLS